jgi:hypothetical protein
VPLFTKNINEEILSWSYVRLLSVIPAKAGIQEKHWISGRARNDNLEDRIFLERIHRWVSRHF